MFGLFFIVLVSSYSNFVSAFNDIKNTNPITIIVVLFLLMLLTITINIFGIEFSLIYKKSLKTDETNNTVESKTKSRDKTHTPFLIYIVTAFIAISVLIIFSYLYGKLEENQRTTYKIIEEPLTSTDNTDTKFVFTSPEKNSYKLSAVIYENKDIYILARLYKKDDKIILDKDYQKIIDKDDIITYTYNNIYNIVTQ